MRKSIKAAVLAIAPILILAAATWLMLIYPIRQAESTHVGKTNMSYWAEAFLDVDCSAKKYQAASWRQKFDASRSLNYWAAKARNAEEAAEEYSDLRKFKLSDIAASDAGRYWTTVAYLKLELECYDIAAATKDKPY